MEELPKELMGVVFDLGGFTFRDLPLLASVSRSWRRLVADPAVERALFAGSAFYVGNKLGRASSPTVKSLLPAGVRASSVALSDAHMALVTRDAARELQTWGYAHYGRLGEPADPVEAAGAATMEKSGHYVEHPRTVAGAAGRAVGKVALGPHHTVALLANGEVHAFGTNECCQLGTGGERSMNNAVPRRLDALQRERVVDVAVGYSTNLALTADGRVFTFGEGYGGGLGHGDEEDQPVPRLLDAGGLGAGGRVVIVAIAAGFYDHNLALAADGTVYSFGGCKYGELGHGELQQAASTPRAVEALRGVRVVAIAAGDYHSLALSDAGEVWAWGLGKAGQLGHGDRANHCLPKRVEALATAAAAGVRVEQIAAGEDHSVALADDGSLYGFGRANMGQLGRLGVVSPAQGVVAATGEQAAGGGEKRPDAEGDKQQQQQSGTSKGQESSSSKSKRYLLPVLLDAGPALARLPISRIAAFRQTTVLFT